MVVGIISSSPREIVMNSRGKPLAANTPRFTASATERKRTLQSFSSLQELQMPITGRPAKACRVIDAKDARYVDELATLGIAAVLADIVMTDAHTEVALARHVLAAA